MIRILSVLFLAGAAGVASAQTPTTQATPKASLIDRAIDALAMKAATLPADRRASLVRGLQSLGPSSVDALLQRLNGDTPAMAELRKKSPAAHDAFVAAVEDALGSFRAARAEPTFTRLFQAAESSSLVARMAGEGLGRLCTESTISTLAGHAQTGDLRQFEAANALGLCRTESSEAVLTAWLATNPPPETTRAIALGLGMMGSSWAWKALGPDRAGEGLRIRSTASAALMQAYPHYNGDAAEAIATALLMVDDPSVEEAIQKLPAKDLLAKRWARAHR